MALRGAICDRARRGDDDGMSVVEERTVTTREPSGALGKSEHERYIALVAKAKNETTVSATITRGVSKGWRFRCRPGDLVELWAPPTGDKAITYSLRSAALWRAIKKRGISLK